MESSVSVEIAAVRDIARLKAKLARAQQRVVRPREAEQMLGISHRHLYELISRGELETFRLGRARFITAASIGRYLTAQLKKFFPSRPAP